MYLYMITTNDKYELPLAVFDSASQLAKFVGVSVNTVYSGISKKKNGIYKTCRFHQIEVDREEIRRADNSS